MAKARHRILTWRMVVAALLLGVVLAVVSVPVAALGQGLSPIASRGSTTLEYGIDLGSGLYFRVGRDAFLGGAVWEVETTDAFGTEELAFMLTEGVAPPVDTLAMPTPWPEAIAGRTGEWLQARNGWPAHAAVAYTEPPPKTVHVRNWRHGVFVGSTLIPLRPLWPGLLANTGFYAALMLAPMVLLRWRRTRRRRARGLCVACGYALGESVGVCPVCGPVLPATSNREA